MSMFVFARYVFLDSPLLFFVLITVWAEVASWKYIKNDCHGLFWYWKLACGIFLGCAISVKFVGLFVVILIGWSTLFQLYYFWSNADTYSILDCTRKLIGYAVCLIILPLCIYVCFFAVHLKIINRTGTGDGFYSSQFQVNEFRTHSCAVFNALLFSVTDNSARQPAAQGLSSTLLVLRCQLYFEKYVWK